MIRIVVVLAAFAASCVGSQARGSDSLQAQQIRMAYIRGHAVYAPIALDIPEGWGATDPLFMQSISRDGSLEDGWLADGSYRFESLPTFDVVSHADTALSFVILVEPRLAYDIVCKAKQGAFCDLSAPSILTQTRYMWQHGVLRRMRTRTVLGKRHVVRLIHIGHADGTYGPEAVAMDAVARSVRFLNEE